MLQKIEDALNKFLNTEDEEVRERCVYDMLDYQSMDDCLDHMQEFIDALEDSKTRINDLRVKFLFHKKLLERDIK